MFFRSSSAYAKIQEWLGRIPPKVHFFGHFSIVPLSPHPHSRRGLERIRQGEGRWTRPSKTALERSDFFATEKFPVSTMPYRGRDGKKNSWPIPVPTKTRIISPIDISYFSPWYISQTSIPHSPFLALASPLLLPFYFCLVPLQEERG